MRRATCLRMGRSSWTRGGSGSRSFSGVSPPHVPSPVHSHFISNKTRTRKDDETEEKEEKDEGEEGREKTRACRGRGRWVEMGRMEVGLRAGDSRVLFRDGSWECGYSLYLLITYTEFS